MKTLLIATLRGVFRFTARSRRWSNTFLTTVQNKLSHWELDLIESQTKTDILREFAMDNGFDVIELHTASMDAINLQGLPVFNPPPLSTHESVDCSPHGCEVNN